MPPIDPAEPTLPPNPPGSGDTLPYAPPPYGDVSRIVGDYELLGEISRGGMGVVYRARQVSLNRLVALKMILAGRLASASEVRRFRIEAESAAQLDHPNIVPIYEVGEHEGQPYFSMALVGAGNLAGRIAIAPMAVAEAAAVVKQLATAVQYAHEQGIVHRDLKPANVLLDENGSPRITDFGLAKRAQSSDGPTATGDILGTPAYMAPEQAAGQTALVGPLTDVYALGAVLYACLTGRPPFLASTPFDTQMQVIEQEPVRPSKLRAGIPRDLETICLKCLEKRPDRRYASAKELANDLQRFLDGESIRARPASRVRRAWIYARKRPWVLSAAATLALLVLGCLAFGLRAEIRERGAQVDYLTARADRLALPPNPPPDAIRNIAQRLRQATAVRPDMKIYDEAVQLAMAAGRGYRRAFPRPGLEPDPPMHVQETAALLAGSFQWDRSGRELLYPGGSINAVSGHRTVLKIGEFPALADPSGRWLAATNGKTTLHILDRETGKERRIESKAAGIGTLRFTESGNELAMIADTGGERPARVVEFWNPGSERPRIAIPIPQGNVIWRISGDGSRLVWGTSPDQPLTVMRTDTGATIASVPLIGAFAILANLALSPDGTMVAWTQLGYRSNESQRVQIQDAATGRMLFRLNGAGGLSLVDQVVFSPDGRTMVGRESFSERIEGKFITRYRILVWDISESRLVVVLPGDAFAAGTGANGEIAIARRIGAGDSAPIVLDIATPETIANTVAEMGLSDNVNARPLDELELNRLRNAFPEYLFSWPFGLGFLAALSITLAQKHQEKRGLPAPPLIALAATGAGLVAAAAGLARLFAVIEHHGGRWLELSVDLSLGSLPIFCGVVAMWYGIRNYRSAASGRNAPVMLPPSNRWRQFSEAMDRLAYFSVAAGLLFVAFAIQDRFIAGLSPTDFIVAVALVTAAGFIIGPLLVLLMRRLRSIWTRLVPSRALEFDRLFLIVTGIWSAVAIGRRVVALEWKWPSGAPDGSTTLLTFVLERDGRSVFPLAAAADALAIVFFLAMFFAVRRRREQAAQSAAVPPAGTN